MLTTDIPAEFEPVAVLTIGYPGEVDALPNPLKERELAPPTHKPVGEIMFEGGWPAAPAERYDQAKV